MKTIDEIKKEIAKECGEEPILYTEEDMNKAFDLGFQWSKTNMTEGPLTFLWKKFNKKK